MFSVLSRRCPLLATSCPSFSVCFPCSSPIPGLIWFWFRLSCDHGWIRSGSANARKQQQQPTEVTKDETKRAFWDRLDSLVQRIPAKECLYVLMDANARTGRRIEGESLQDEGILGTYGRDELNDNGKLLLSFATDNKLDIMNTFFSTRKGGVSHTYNGVTGSRTSDFKRIDYVLTRQAH